MSFTGDISFFAFLVATLFLYWKVPTERERAIVLFSASMVFYGCYSIYYLGLLVASIAINLVFLRYIWKEQHPVRLIMIIGVFFNLSILALFKYYNFFATNINLLSPFLLPILTLSLPMGISYYTFVIIGYLIDAYRDKKYSRPSLLGFINYITFFPKIISGPITTSRDFYPLVANPPDRLAEYQVSTGISLIIIGLAKKTLIADVIAYGINEPLWTQWKTLQFWDAWLAATGYTLQLYFDFSGYSDMAVGIGMLFGLTLPFNFNSPYQALNFSDFWRRWHITLSNWLATYCYIPLGGSRGSKLTRYRNVLITMSLCGLWHGANWTFIIWGAVHGFLIIIYRLFQSQWDRVPRIAIRIIMFFLIVMSWVFFRAPSVEAGVNIFKSMFGFNGMGSISNLWANKSLLLAMVVGLIYTQFLKDTKEISLAWNWKWAVILSVLAVFGILMMQTKSEFLYLRF
jgi:D-alanyl-lipoteichoic acid acyltransferase DltB (MBOAT superfamily)